MKKIFLCLVFIMGIASGNAQSFDLNNDGAVNSGDVVALYNHIIRGGESVLAKDDVVGTWRVVYGEYVRLEDDKVVSEEKGSVEDENNFYIIYSNNKLCFLEYSDYSETWHEDGSFIYTIYNGEFNMIGNLRNFKLEKLDNDQVRISYSFDEDKGSYVVTKKNTETLKRISKATNLIPYRQD